MKNRNQFIFFNLLTVEPGAAFLVSGIITPLSCQTEISISLNYLQEGRLQDELCQRIRNVFRLRDPVEKLNRSAEKRQGRQTKL